MHIEAPAPGFCAVMVAPPIFLRALGADEAESTAAGEAQRDVDLRR